MAIFESISDNKLEKFTFDLPSYETERSYETREEYMFSKILEQADSLDRDDILLILVGAEHHVLADKFRHVSPQHSIEEIFFKFKQEESSRLASLDEKVERGLVKLIDSSNTEKIPAKLDEVGKHLTSWLEITTTHSIASEANQGAEIHESTASAAASSNEAEAESSLTGEIDHSSHE